MQSKATPRLKGESGLLSAIKKNTKKRFIGFQNPQNKATAMLNGTLAICIISAKE